MKKNRILSFLALFLSVIMLIGCLPMGVFAFEGDAQSVADYRGSTMSEDENGVEIYDELAQYRAKSAKDVLLSTDYYVDHAATSTSTSSVLDTRYPDLTVDWALYYDPSIAGTTVVVKQGLSEIDSVSYVDAEGNVTTGKSPKELTASNGGDENSGAGYGENAAGETTVHYKEKSVLFYLINHSCSARIGQEDDISILSDYIAEGYLVVVLDFKNHANAVTPYIEQSLTAARGLFTSGNSGNEVSDLTDSDGKAIATSIHFFYFLPEGCRLARDIWYFDPSIWGLNGLMEEHVKAWNGTFAGTSKDVLGIGTLTSVEDMITRLKQTDGSPIDYKHCMNVIYPSQPKDDYKAPVYLQEGSLPIKENNVHNTYTRGTYTGFALNGYAAIMYDHPFHPFLLDRQYYTPDNYGVFYSSYNNARAAVRCVRYYADTFGYDAELIGAAGISKATIGASVLSVVGNEDLQGSVSGYNNQVSFGDIYEEGVANTEKTPDNRLKAIVQPFKTAADGETELDAEVTCTYCSSGFGIEMLFGRQTFANEQRVPMVISDGIRDPYNCYNYFDYLESWYDINVDTPYLLIPMLDQGHAYPVGYDDQYGYDRFEAMIRFFDVHLKPEENKAPEVLWITPTDGSVDVPVSGEWNSGPFTPVGWEMNSYDRIHKVQVKFLKPVTADSVNYGMVVTDGAGNRVGGTWVASEAETMYTFEFDGFMAGTTYTITATKDIKSKDGVALAEEKSVTFTTEGTYALRPAADTYVSISKPDAVYGEENALLVDTDHIALLSYPAASVASASKITLSSLVSRDANTSVTVWAMPNIKVDEAALTYNLLTASDAWKQKVSLGSYEISSAELALDLSALSEIENAGNYITLAIVSNETAIENAFVFEEDYEGYTAGTEINSGRNALANSPYSEEYIVKLSGNYGATHIVELDGSNVIRFLANDVNTIRFYNMLKDGDLTADDIGKTYRISFRIKTELAGASYYGFMSATAGEGSSNSVGAFTGPVSPYSNAYCEGDRTAFTTEANVWKDMCVYVTVTEAMVNTQAGMFTIQPPNYVESHYTWFDDFKVEEAEPRVTLLSSEGATNGRVSLVTTNSTAVEFPEGDLEGGSSWTDTSTPNISAATPADGAEE
ncbi:MAG: Ig-like domain-containing protein, partial [Clostridia bacterium]|nr:Ig-like domain-containing protein [Clostridia bacterium]